MNYSVFVSSTFEDLAAHSQAVLRAMGENGLMAIPVEANLTDPAQFAQANLKALKHAQVFVGIYASRYGDILKNYELSLTELLYEEAGRLKIPRLIYLVDPKASWAIEHLHTNFQGAMMRIFLDRFQNDPEIRYFDTPQDLTQKVLLDLAALITQTKPNPPIP